MTSPARKWWSQGEADIADDEPNAELQKKHWDEHPVISRRIHILGVGTVGIFVAHSLAGIPNRPPITLLLHRRKLWIDWHQDTERPETLEVITEGMSDVRKNFDVERVMPSWKLVREPPADEVTIHNLIVTVKGPRVLSALSLVSHRLNQRSTIVFLQTGMGILDEVNEKLFKDVETRPNYILGLLTHTLYPEEPFSVTHARLGTTAFAFVPRSPLERAPDGAGQRKDVWPPTSRYLLRTLTRTPVLAAVGFSPTDLTLLQLDKLTANAVIGPLTVMFDCKNGDLLFNNSVSRVMRLLLSEISLVIRSLPELQGVPNVQMRFSPDRLESMIVSIATMTAENLSGMLREVRAGNETEIDYINGYFIKRGEEIGIKCVMNYMLLQMVKGKRIIVNKEVYSQLPLEGFLGPS
ncbi:MAG: 2-dehydropantoate 2-reductase [Lasallia pustulata]|uniref:2-dehydropantoate 2-reductase n=1 Tax=Lasallia pustulata TaxID=136370 RepID=A0A5M8PH26_9LECA|nr:MAG: 2-dehydropantoate 2-reductase [Lasallia pustulata]